MSKRSDRVSYTAVAALMVSNLCVGVVYIWSALKGAVEQYFSWSAASANMVSSIMLFAFTGGCFLGGLLSDSIGPRKTSVLGTALFGCGVFVSSLLAPGASIGWFYLTYCVTAGTGSGFVYSSALSGLPKWFPERVGLGTGLGAGSFALSTVVLSPFAAWLLKIFTVTATLRIIAVCTFSLSLAACLFIRMPDEAFRTAHPFREPGKVQCPVNMNLTEAMRIPSFWILFLCMFFYNGAWNMLTPLIKGLGMERGLTEGAAIACLSLTGLANALGRIGMSVVSDRIGRYGTMIVLCSLTGLSSAAVATVPGAGFFFMVLLLAFAYGGPAAVFPALCTDLFGPEFAGRNYGFICFGLGLSSLTFNALSNVLYSSFGNYIPTFLTGTASAMITLALVLLIRRRVRTVKLVMFGSRENA